MNVAIRTPLERLSRNVSFRRHLPSDLGAVPIIVTPSAALSFWKPRLSSDLFDFAREFVKPGNVVWDLGANVGLFTIAAAQRAGTSGKVVAIEADIWLAAILRKSLALQPPSSSRVQVLPVAVADSLGIATFNIANRGRASNFLATSAGSTQTGGVRESVSVLTVTLDWLFEKGVGAPNVLKIDVEGAEIFVLNGAKRVLSEVKPIVLCEVGLEASREIVTEIFIENGYTIYDWESKPRIRTDRACFNTLAIPPAS